MNRLLLVLAVSVLCHLPEPVLSQAYRGIRPKTFAEDIARSDASVIAEWVRNEDSAESLAGNSIYRVTKLLKNFDDKLKLGKLKTGDEITVESATDDPPKTPKSQWALFGYNLKQGRAKKLAWLYRKVTKTGAKYISETPSPDRPPIERLKFFVKYLEHKEDVLADDACREFLKSPYEAVATVGKELSPRAVRGWIANPDTVQVRLGLYGQLLGLCGKSEDAEFLKKKIKERPNGRRVGMAGLMSGYLVLAGEDGLAFLNEELRDFDSHWEDSYGALQSLRHMWHNRPGDIKKERLLQSARILLDRADMREMVIINLIYWKDWSVIDRLMKLYPMEKAQGKRRIIEYLLACSRDLPPNTAPSKNDPDHVEAARKSLEKIRKTDAKRIEEVEDYLKELREFQRSLIEDAKK